ncbi:MAG TPA: hypothetical protein VGV15_13925 [Terriglobales bacterium]|nr:hypothetical protein [Terriglobales bacterium]
MKLAFAQKTRLARFGDTAQILRPEVLYTAALRPRGSRYRDSSYSGGGGNCLLDPLLK